MEALKDYEGLYLINKEGEIYSIKRKGTCGGNIKKTLNKKNGYYYVSLNNKTYSLHRLLAIQYIPNPEGKPTIDHIDRNRQNNSLDNLRWATHSENNKNMKVKGCVHLNMMKKKDKVYNYFRVQIRHNKIKYSKSFKTREEAEEHLKEKVEEYNSML